MKTMAFRICAVLPVLPALIAAAVAPGFAATPDEPQVAYEETSPLSASGEAELVIPRPDLRSLQRTPRARIEKLQDTLEQLLAADDTETSELAEAFGFLGRFFHAFDKLDAAEICYRNSRTVAPEEVDWPFYLGLISHSKGDLDGAVGGYGAALTLEPEDTAIRLRLANALLDLGRAEEARIHFDSVLRRDGESAAALFGLGKLADLDGDSARAVELFEGALARQPQASIVHYPLSQAYRGLGDEEKAALHLSRRGDRRVVFLDPRADMLNLIAKNSALGVVADLAADADFNEENFLGFVLSQLGTTKGAAQELERVVEKLDGEDRKNAVQRGRLEYAIGALLAGEGRDQQAIEHLERALTGDQGLHDARVKLGNALARSGRFEEAVESYDRALQTNADDPEVLAKRASALVNLERAGQARIDLLRVVELEPESHEGWRLLAGVEERMGKPEAAADALGRALETAEEPETKMALHTQLADIYYRQRSFETAAREYLKALRIDQGYVPALDRLAGLLGRIRDYDRSAEVYAKWIVREPTNIKPRVGEATALVLAGRHGEARDRVEAGLKVLPESLDLKDILARHLAASPDRSVRDGERAVELANEVYKGIPTAESLATLAMAYAEAGRYEQAVSWQERLLEQAAGAEVPAETVELWRSNLRLYQDRQPCCAAR